MIRPDTPLTGAQKKQLAKAVKRAKRDGKIAATAQQTIPYEEMYQNGVCSLGSHLYSKSVIFEDRSYTEVSDEEKGVILELYCRLVNYFGPSVAMELSVVCFYPDLEEYRRILCLRDEGDGFDPIRRELSDLLMDKASQCKTERRLCMTFTVEAEDARKACQDTVGGIDAFYLSFVDEGDAVALARFVDDGGGSNDGDTPLLQSAKHSPEFLAGHGVDARSGFVQKEDIRFMDKGTAKGEFLLHAAGQRSGAALAERFYLPVNVAHQIIILLDGGVEDGGEEIEILLHRQVRIEGEASGHIPHPPADGFVVLHHIQTADRSRASVGKQQSGEDAEKRCLARTVRPDDAEKLTGSH